MKINRSLTAAALLIAMLCTAACGSSDTQKPADTDAGTVTAAETSAAPAENVYPYEEADLGGYTLRILNMDDIWDMFIKIDTEATDGEVLNDAVYQRNRKAEQTLNFVIEETRLLTDMSEHNKLVQDIVLSGDDSYDITYVSVNQTPALVTEGYLMNLLDIDGLHIQD